MKRKIVFGVVVLFWIFFPFISFAYETETHTFLAEKTLEFYNNESSQKISQELAPFLIDGVRREDDAPRWMNHFYDPVYNRGLSYDPTIDPGVNLGTWQASKNWVNDEENQNKTKYKISAVMASILTAVQKQKISEVTDETNFTWNKALRLYIKGDKEGAMFALGHVIHLLQDLSVPDHTRNDPHPNDSVYENFSRKNPPVDKMLADKKMIQLNFLGDYFNGLAVYSNNNFYSKDTIGIQSGYNSPQPDYVLSLKGLNYGFRTDYEFGDFPLLRGKGILSLKNDSILDDVVINAYWSRLSVKSIQYSAGVIDLFFKEAERLKNDKEFLAKEDLSLLASLLASLESTARASGKSLRDFFFGIQKIYQNITFADIEKFEALKKETNKNSEIKKEETIEKIIIPNVTSSPISTILELPTSSEALILGTSTKTLISTSSNSSSSPLGDFTLRINEIMYDVPGSDEKKEWIEIYHTGGDAINLSRLSFLENKTKHKIAYVSGSSTLVFGDYAIIAENPEEFLKTNFAFPGNLFKSAMSLSNTGEELSLFGEGKQYGTTSYSATSGAQGNGMSLQYFSIWEASFPTPGRANIRTQGGGGRSSSQPQQSSTSNKKQKIEVIFSPAHPMVGESVFFSASSSTIFPKYEWNFGDNSATTTTQNSTTHSYEKEGEKSISVSVTDVGNEVITGTTLVTIEATSSVFAVNHIVISEILFDAEGGDNGKEFIELYNPSSVPINLDNWAMRYRFEESTTTNSIVAFNTGSGDQTIIPSKGYLLIGLSNYNAENYMGRTADVKRSRSLPNGSTRVHVVLSDAEDIFVDEAVYSTESIQKEGQSIERRTIIGDVCYSPQSSFEFLGNGCDSGAENDFITRENPLPQNSFNLIEPRERPQTPSPLYGSSKVIEFKWNELGIQFNWADVLQNVPNAIITYKVKEVGNSPVGLSNVETVATSTFMRITDVGRSYEFEISAKDNEGYTSLPHKETIFVPRFIERLHAYPDPRPEKEGKYAMEFYYNSFPFIPDIYSKNMWQAMVFYKNREPNPNNIVLDSRNGYKFSDNQGIVSVKFPQCAGGGGMTEEALIFPLKSEYCGIGGGLHNSALDFTQLEDKHILIEILPNGGEEFNENDYFTVAFYDFSDSGGGKQILSLVALDKNKNSFSRFPQNQYSPELNAGMEVVFDSVSSNINLVFPSVDDRDTLNNRILIESNYSPFGEVLDENLWTPIESPKTVSSGESFLVSARAKDDFGNVSPVVSVLWQYPTTTIFIQQEQSGTWSDVFGTTNFNSFEPDTASFQSFSPEENFSFDFVSLRLKQEVVSDVADVRLSIFPANEDGSINSTVLLGQTILSLLNPSEEKQTFSFSNPIGVEADKTYWLALDVARYSDNRGYFRNKWRNAVAGDETYTRGHAGRGYGNGLNPGTDMFGYSGNYSFGPADWWFKIGKRIE